MFTPFLTNYFRIIKAKEAGSLRHGFQFMLRKNNLFIDAAVSTITTLHNHG